MRKLREVQFNGHRWRHASHGLEIARGFVWEEFQRSVIPAGSPDFLRMYADLKENPYVAQVERPRVVTDERNGREFRIVSGVVETRHDKESVLGWVTLEVCGWGDNLVTTCEAGLGLDVTRIRLLADLADYPTELVDAE